MDSLLLLVGFIFVLVGIVGSFLPVLPGPILSWLGLVVLYCTEAIPVNYWVLGISLLFVVIISVLDYVIPAKGTKKFGGSKYGVIGTNIGMVIGFFLPIPFGFIVGAFLGAFIGELYFDKSDKERALKSATGSLLGFLASSFVKFVFGIIFLGTYLYIVWQNWSVLF